MGEERKNRTMHFITGISLGLVLGGSIVYFTQNINLVRYPLEVSQNTIEGIVSKVLGAMSSKKDSIPSDKQKLNTKYFKAKVLSSIKDSSLVNEQKDSVETEAIVSSDQNNDSDTNLISKEQNIDLESETINVRKDELEEIKYIETTTVDFQLTSNEDSSSAALAGIQIEKQKPKKFNLYVEFWKSPLNYKGYKFSKNKLILFGINPDEEIKMILVKENYYMQYSSATVKLSATNNFKSFEKIVTPEILSSFN